MNKTDFKELSRQIRTIRGKVEELHETPIYLFRREICEFEQMFDNLEKFIASMAFQSGGDSTKAVDLLEKVYRKCLKYSWVVVDEDEKRVIRKSNISLFMDILSFLESIGRIEKRKK